MDIVLSFAINNFLEECKRRVAEGNLILVPRKKNSDSIREMGLTIIDVEEIIMGLEEKDYYRGPSKDHKFQEDYVYEFIVEDIKRIYIKLKLDNSNNTVCISFHEAER